MPAPTLNSLLTKLSRKLNDPDGGQWAKAELTQYVNDARRNTIVQAECNIAFVELDPLEGVGIYDFAPLLKVLGLRLGWPLTKRKAESMGIIQMDWDNTYQSGHPTEWIPLRGSTVRVHPAPSSSSLGIVEELAWSPTAGGAGYAYRDELTIDGGQSSNLAKVYVAGVRGGGAVQSVYLWGDAQGRPSRGRGYTTGAGKATTAVTGSGVGCTVNITSLSKFRACGVADIDDYGDGMIATVAEAPTVAGTGYTVGDLLAVTEATGSNGTVRVTAITGAGDTGPVDAIELVQPGLGYTAASGLPTAGGTGSGCTVEVATVRDGSALPMLEIPLPYAERAILLDAQRAARMARPTMFGALEVSQALLSEWQVVCADIKAAWS